MRLLKAFMQLGLFTDLLILVGLSMIFYGLHLHWPWLAFTVVGGLITFLAIRMIK